MKLVKVYLMQYDNKENSLKALNNNYIKEFCSKFGGCTAYNAQGFYVGKGGKLYKDKDLVCEIFVDTKKIFSDNKKAMFSYFKNVAERYKREAKQECVSIVVDGQAFII